MKGIISYDVSFRWLVFERAFDRAVKYMQRRFLG